MARKTSTAGSRSLKSTPSICDAAVSLDSVLCTAELNRRLSRPPDYQAENRALVALAQELADSPRTILQKLVEIALELCEAGSAGVSLLSKKDCGKTFYWPAIAGAWTPHLGSGTPRDFGPCGVVLDRDAVQLFTHPERYYPYLIPVTPPIGEALLTPFYVGGKAVGTVWVIAHDDQRKFDAEDMRQIVSLAKFASAAYKVWESLDAVEQQDEALRHRTAQYETLLNEAPLGVHLVDADFRIRQVNPTALPVFGNIPDLVGRDFDEVMHIIWPKPYADQIVERFRHTLKTGEPYLVSEWTGERRDRGASEFYEWQINRIPLPEGRYGVVCYFRDISRHVVARAAIAKFEARLRLVVEGAKDHAVYTIDADGCIDYWNTGAQALFGFTENEIIGQSAAILFTPQDRECKEPERKLCEANQRGSAQDERWYVRKDGTRFYASGVLTLLRDARIEGGTTHGYAMIARDLTERKQAEEQLRESEEKYRSLFNSIDEGFCVIEMIFDADGKPVDYRFLEVSPSFEKQTGITDAKGKRMREIAPQHEEHWFDTYGKIALTGEPARFENRAEQLHRWYDVYAFRVEQPESRKVAILFKDITERKQAEQRVSQSEEQLRAIFEASRDGILVENSERIVYVNNSYARLLMYDPEELIGAHVSIVTPSEDGKMLLEFGRRRLRGEQAPVNYEFRGRRKDGVLIDLEASVSTHTVDGKTFITTTIRDIAERKRAEEALRQSESKYRLLMEQASDGIHTYDSTGNFVDTNSKLCEMLGYTREEMLRLNVKDLIPPEDLTGAPVLFDQLRNGHTLLTERRLRCKDGTPLPVEISGRMIQEGMFQSIIRDITNRKRAEEALRQSYNELERRVQERTAEIAGANKMLKVEMAERLWAQQARQELLRRLVFAQEDERRRISRELHDEMGQQLTAIMMGLKTLNAASHGRQSSIAKLQQLQELTDQLASGVHSLAWELRPPALDDLGLETALYNYAEEWAERSRVVVDFHSSGFETERLPLAHETTIYRIAQEALTNVFKHSMADRVSFILERRGDHVLAVVEDNGQGFDVQALQEKSTEERNLGLLGMRERASLLGGTLAIESEPGIGTSVFVRIPLEDGRRRGVRA
ncbi:MAG: PAS domain S-box protein [Acidobacteriota bacterium]